MSDALDDAWQTYRRACDRVDLLRWDSAFDLGADLDRRLRVAQQLVSFREDAVRTSERLVELAKAHADVDADWLAELSTHHVGLKQELKDAQQVVDDTNRRLRPPRT